MIQHSESMIEYNTATSQIAKTQKSVKKHNKAVPTLSDILYTSQLGDTIYQEPITDSIPINTREIQCRTENWTDSWKNALNSLTDASISMQGYLCKMTASKWNSRGTLDKIQRRWFVLRGNYMTYYKTNLHTQPKSDKCVNLLNYKVNPVQHSKSKYAFELISTPNKQNKHNTKERTKFILIPDLDVNEIKQREIRDKWVKSLRLATKGAFLWDVLLNLHVENPPNASPTNHEYNNEYQNNSHHANSQTAFVSSSHQHRAHHHKNIHSGHHQYRDRAHSPKNFHHHDTASNHPKSTEFTYNRRQYKNKRDVGGNTQDYPDSTSPKNWNQM